MDSLKVQLDLLSEPSPGTPEYEEIRSAEDLSDASAVLRRLSQIEWGFADENTTFLAHDIHPYPAKFVPQIPGHLIANLSLRGELVLDPFGGSGTTAIEAVRLGRRALSVDANPVAVLIGRVKSARLEEAAVLELRSLQSAVRAQLGNLPTPTELLAEYAAHVPNIPNIDKWFPTSSRGELALLASYIRAIENGVAKDIASLALSRIILKASFQDSETRYASKPRPMPAGDTLTRFLETLHKTVAAVAAMAPELALGFSEFAVGDARKLDPDRFKDGSVDLVVTSPPYGNANDYHLYHRFRLFWLGSDPKDLARIEIGSHLKHQREGSGFDSYLDDMLPCLREIFRLLRSGRYAAIVVADSQYKGRIFKTDEALEQLSRECGFEFVGSLTRPIHKTKRSFVHAGRRANKETILILRKPSRPCVLRLIAPSYRMWPYEADLSKREIKSVLATEPVPVGGGFEVTIDPYKATRARHLTFTRRLRFEDGHYERTWQQILENGLADAGTSRKDPKYATHGIHPYKGKFYPQLAKSLINAASMTAGARVLDPFCGSGTSILEAHLNGLRAFGCDLHPLAAKIASAKVGILQADPKLVDDTLSTLADRLTSAPQTFPANRDQFSSGAVTELDAWFAQPVLDKLNWVLRAIRSVSAGTTRDYLEVILSSLIRSVSHQEPRDLRIRRRKKPLEDADVIGMYRERLTHEEERLRHFWSVAGYNPNRPLPATVIEGDARLSETYSRLGIAKGSIDLILTSPPYATALPYIDTDRLSLLVLQGMTSADRRPLDLNLTGSREILISSRRRFEAVLEEGEGDLPAPILGFVRKLYIANQQGDVGFRRQNKPALLVRFFRDMRTVFRECFNLLAPGGEAVLVVGDNFTTVEGEKWRIPTTDFVGVLGEEVGLTLVERIPISVTTDNLKHARNAITENTVLRFHR